MKTHIHGMEAYVKCSGCLFPDFINEADGCIKTVKRKTRYKDPFHLSMLEGMEVTATYGMPVIEPYVGPVPRTLATFSRSVTDYRHGFVTNYCPCFYQDDSDFTHAVDEVEQHIPMLKLYKYAIGLDLPVQGSIPYSTKVNNIYNNKLWTRYVQMKGVSIIPNIVWTEPELYEICFEGFPEGSIVAINSVTVNEESNFAELWLNGYMEMLKRLKPKHIIRFGEPVPGEDKSISTFFDNNHLKRMRHGR